MTKYQFLKKQVTYVLNGNEEKDDLSYDQEQ